MLASALKPSSNARNNMNKGRLRKLANFLEKLPTSEKNKFDMIGWGIGDDASCEFAGCAIGHALHAKLFLKEGFTSAIDPPQRNSCYTTIPCYKNDENWFAVRRFFKLNTKDTEFLFSHHSYEETMALECLSPQIVAKRIKEFIGE